MNTFSNSTPNFKDTPNQEFVVTEERAMPPLKTISSFDKTNSPVLHSKIPIKTQKNLEVWPTVTTITINSDGKNKLVQVSSRLENPEGRTIDTEAVTSTRPMEEKKSTDLEELKENKKETSKISPTATKKDTNTNGILSASASDDSNDTKEGTDNTSPRSVKDKPNMDLEQLKGNYKENRTTSEPPTGPTLPTARMKDAPADEGTTASTIDDSVPCGDKEPQEREKESRKNSESGLSVNERVNPGTQQFEELKTPPTPSPTVSEEKENFEMTPSRSYSVSSEVLDQSWAEMRARYPPEVVERFKQLLVREQITISVQLESSRRDQTLERTGGNRRRYFGQETQQENDDGALTIEIIY